MDFIDKIKAKFAKKDDKAIYLSGFKKTHDKLLLNIQVLMMIF